MQAHSSIRAVASARNLLAAHDIQDVFSRFGLAEGLAERSYRDAGTPAIDVVGENCVVPVESRATVDDRKRSRWERNPYAIRRCRFRVDVPTIEKCQYGIRFERDV